MKLSKALPWFLANLNRNTPKEVWADDFMVLDFETTELDKGSALNPENNILLASYWSSITGEMITLIGNEWEIGARLKAAVEAHSFVVAHSAKFEAQWLMRCGVDLKDVLFWCTMIGEHVIHGNLLALKHRRKDQNLDRTAKRYGLKGKLAWVSLLIKQGLVQLVPTRYLAKYCELDVELCRDIFYQQELILEEQKKLPVFFTRMITMPVLADTEFRGMHLDADRLYKEYEKTHKEYVIYSRKMDALTGGINWKSHPQVAHYLYEDLEFEELRDRSGEPMRNAASKQFPNGQPKTDKDTVAELKATTPEQRSFVKLKKKLGVIHHALTKNLEFFKGACDEQDGVFHAQFNQTSTATHRLSSSGIPTLYAEFDKAKSVQFQNLPRVYKPLFSARRDGWLVGEVDGSQLEFRVAVGLGQDKQGHKDIRTPGFDVHKLSAETIYGATDDKKLFKSRRTKAKTDTFKPLYGGTSGTPRQRKYYKAFRETYPDIDATQKGWVADVVKTKRLRVASGLEFFWPDTFVSHSGYVKNNESIHNYPVQSFATAEIIPISLVYFWHRLQRSDLEMYIINTIHDSIIIELPRGEVIYFVELSRDCFGKHVFEYLSLIYGVEWDVPLGVGVNASKHWQDGANTVWELGGFDAPDDDLFEEWTEDFENPNVGVL